MEKASTIRKRAAQHTLNRTSIHKIVRQTSYKSFINQIDLQLLSNNRRKYNLSVLLLIRYCLLLRHKHRLCKQEPTILTIMRNTDPCIYIKIKESFEKLSYPSIYYLEASGSYCNIFLSDNKKLTIARPLGDITGYLCPDTFIRVHRSFTVNKHYVDQYTGDSFIVKDRPIPIGRAYKKEVLTHFNIVIMEGKEGGGDKGVRRS